MNRHNKIIIIALSLMLCFSSTAYAATSTASLSSSNKLINAGNMVTITVNVSNYVTSSLGIIPYYDSDVFDFVSGKWLVTDAALMDFSDGVAVIAYSDPTTFSGNVFQFVLKAKTSINPGNYQITCRVHAEGYQELNLSIILNGPCGTHSWDAGQVVKPPTYKEDGQITYTCTVCGRTKTESIPKLEYLLGDFNDDKLVTDADAIYLLYYTFFPEEYPLNQSGDFNRDGLVTDADAVYLLYYTFFPNEYPLEA